MTPDVMRDWRDNNGLPAKVPNARVKENQALAIRGSNSESTPASKNPGALAGATGAIQIEQIFKAKHYITDRESATALCHAILACDPADACEIMAVAFADLYIGMPIAPLIGVMDEASFWADLATQDELKAYTLACFTRLTPRNQAAFLGYVGGVAAA